RLHVVVLLRLAQCPPEAALDRPVDGVEDDGSVERDDGEALALLKEHVVGGGRRDLDLLWGCHGKSLPPTSAIEPQPGWETHPRGQAKQPERACLRASIEPTLTAWASPE